MTASSSSRASARKKAKLLEKLHIRTLRDALETYPRDYEDRTHITPIAEIGMEDKYAVRAVVGTEPKVNRIRKGLTLVKCTIYDETGTLIWEAPCVSARRTARTTPPRACSGSTRKQARRC